MRFEGLEEFRGVVRSRLLAERNSGGYWTGYLSSSPLSTATLVCALYTVDSQKHSEAIKRALGYLIKTVNTDGGWGDTDNTKSNISTTVLCWAALRMAGEKAPVIEMALEGAERWIVGVVGSLEPEAVAKVIADRYGKDRTFSVPILMMAALSGCLGVGREGWERVLALPFELAAFPRSWFSKLRLPVVSYALPALIAIGQARFYHAPPKFFLFRFLRRLAQKRTLRVLEEIQPASGGFLEASPLTSFVCMALASMGLGEHLVVRRGIDFLLDSVREDGSVPIDTDLSTWVTTLSSKGLTVSGMALDDFGQADRRRVMCHLLDQQSEEVHPYTLANPGAWAWTNWSGGVPDADDTAGALLALKRLGVEDKRLKSAVSAGVCWLLDIQNRDGGIPTFCRGWGALPFDRSNPDITAHVISAWVVCFDDVGLPVQEGVREGCERAIEFLERSQFSEGFWEPLWFGNEHTNTEHNLVYGTATVVLALLDFEPFFNKAKLVPGMFDRVLGMLKLAVIWLLKAQNQNGGWGAPNSEFSSIEETSLAIDALAKVMIVGKRIAWVDAVLSREIGVALESGYGWLREHTEDGVHCESAPIGFYFAKLWYYERLYPQVFLTSALERLVLLCELQEV